MRTKIFCLPVLLAALALPAAEGMFPMNGMTPAIAADMKALGCRFNPADLWRPGQKCLAMAVVNLGATGSFVSPDGLIITNHHVAFGAVQSLSSPERNYIRDGFLAAGREQEIPAPGYSVRVMTGFENVSQRFRSAMRPGLAAEKRQLLVEKISKELVAAGEKTPGNECAVAAFYGGREFYLATYFKVRDMRVVYVPARSVGEYGGEVDNWMWPRHTGDFSFLRAYVGRDGRPADFSRDNVPFRPLHHFPVARKPLGEGDFTLILGYPGTTKRWHTAAEVANEVQVGYPQRIALLESYIDLLEKASQADEAVKIKNAGVLKGLYNSIKNNRGLLAGLERDAVLEQRLQAERELAAWIEAAPERKKRYGRLLADIGRLAAAEREVAVLGTISGWLPASLTATWPAGKRGCPSARGTSTWPATRPSSPSSSSGCWPQTARASSPGCARRSSARRAVSAAKRPPPSLPHSMGARAWASSSSRKRCSPPTPGPWPRAAIPSWPWPPGSSPTSPPSTAAAAPAPGPGWR